MKRRAFLQQTVAAPAYAGLAAYALKAEASPAGDLPVGRYSPGRIVNEYNLLLPGEAEELKNSPHVHSFSGGKAEVLWGDEKKSMAPGEVIGGWELVAMIPWMNGTPTAVFEKNVTHQGVILYVTGMGEIARIPKRLGKLDRVGPRPTSTPHNVKFERPAQYIAGPDVCGDYILNSVEDPCYENVAALGAEFIGWTLVANEESGPERSLFLEADGTSRQLAADPQATWAPDTRGRLFDPRRFLPSEYMYDYVPGYSKRTLLGGFLPAADIGVWNPHYKVGYEVMVILPDGAEARPMGRVRAQLPRDSIGKPIPAGDPNSGEPVPATGFVDRYWNCSAEEFFSVLAGIWNRWQNFFAAGMQVEIPDQWLAEAARAGIVLSRCSYQGLDPTYQIGEGAYTKIPTRSHALFPVAHYEFVWTQQLWGHSEQVEPYFQHYLDHYILPDGNFLYNTQDQVEAPLNAGIFLENSARAYDCTGNLEALRKRLPILRRMIDFVVRRYRFSQETFPAGDPRHGLIWGSAEADNGDPQNDFPESHPYYYQNAAWTWRGLNEHARCLKRAGQESQDAGLQRESAEMENLAAGMRADIEQSLAISGNSGTGKTTLASTFAQAACHRGERVLYLNFEESKEAMISGMLSPGIDLRPSIRDKTLLVQTATPESTGSDNHLNRVMETIASFKPNHLVLDAVSACVRMGSKQAAFDFMMRLVSVVKERGITSILTNQISSGIVNDDEELSGIGFSSVVDAVVQLRFVETDEEMIRQMLDRKVQGLGAFQSSPFVRHYGPRHRVP